LHSVVILPVSFNGFTPLQPALRSLIVEFASRLLCAYCFETLDAMKFKSFCNKLQEFMKNNKINDSELLRMVLEFLKENEMKHGNSTPSFLIL
jgi:hypothetical protein